MTSVANAVSSLGGAATSRVASGTTGATSMATSAASRHHGLTGGKIAGIVVGSVVGGLLILGLLLLGCFCLWRKKRKAKKEQKYMTQKHPSIDSTPSSNNDVEHGRPNGITTTAPATGNKKPNENDASQYMSNTDGKADEAAMKNIITPAHMAGVRTADDVAGKRGNIMDHTMQTARHIGDYPVNDVTSGKMTETSGECKHYGAANP